MLRRLLYALLTLWFVTTLTFFMLRIVPGDGVAGPLLAAGAGEEDISARREELGLDDPILVQYANYIVDLLRGNMGVSAAFGVPVNDLIASQTWPTLQLASVAVVVASGLGLGLGIIAASGNIIAQIVVSISLSTPIYWTATLAIVVVAVDWGWLPAGGSDGPAALILPASLLGFHSSGAIAQVTRANVAVVSLAPHVVVAYAKGLHTYRVRTWHILRVALLPTISVIVLQAGFLLSGTVIVESIFVRPGIGRLLLNGVQNRDYTLVQGIVILAAFIYIALNLVADMIYRLLDPRLRV